MKKTNVIISWVLQVVAAVILLQTLFFKFTGAPESIYIFETVGMEPVGRIGSGIAELIASVLFLIPGLAWAGSFVALGVMAGAIFFHLTSLGIVVQDDGGTLFILALIVTISSLVILFLRRASIPVIGKILAPGSGQPIAS